MARSLDGSELLTGQDAGGLLRSAVSNAGGVLVSWELDHVDHRPGRSTKALYRTQVAWTEIDGPDARPREELFGASVHIGEPEKDLVDQEQSLLMTDGELTVRVWRYPHDPWLPMLPRVCYPDVLGRTLEEIGVPTGLPPGSPVPIEVVSYRPGRRAVLRAQLAGRGVFLKVMQPRRSMEVVERHHRLLSAGVPVPQVLAHHEGLVVLAELPGRPLAQAVIEEGEQACRAEDLVALLDRLPASLYMLPLRPPWTDSAEFYAGIVASSVPALGPRLDALVHGIRAGLAEVDRRIHLQPNDVVHGDFYEAQVFVEGGQVVGMLDIDTVGPGRRADDLACLLAHLSVLADFGATGRIPAPVQERVQGAITAWNAVFARRVDVQELALRSAGVVLSLATGPHRQQEAAWEVATEAIVRVAERWVQVAREVAPTVASIGPRRNVSLPEVPVPIPTPAPTAPPAGDAAPPPPPERPGGFPVAPPPWATQHGPNPPSAPTGTHRLTSPGGAGAGLPGGGSAMAGAGAGTGAGAVAGSVPPPDGTFPVEPAHDGGGRQPEGVSNPDGAVGDGARHPGPWQAPSPDDDRDAPTRERWVGTIAPS